MNPHNFLLDNGKTLSIRTTKKGDKISPRVVGQAGISTFNEHFNQFYNKDIENKEEIKNIVYNHIHQMLPIFFDYLFVSDYTVWIQEIEETKFSYTIFDKNLFLDMEFERDMFTFTKDLKSWVESTTLKYCGKSIAEIQIHKNRTFKFRFIMQSVIIFLKNFTATTETFGMTAEKTICDLYNLDYPSNFIGRTSKLIQAQITPIVMDSFKNLPKPIKYAGSDDSSLFLNNNIIPYNAILKEYNIEKNTKCPFDFVLEGDLTLSLKTNTGKMVCPPEVGQPSDITCYAFFKDLCDDTKITNESFKSMVFKNIDKMLKIYVNHLFDSDYLLWIRLIKDSYEYKIFNKNYSNLFNWEKEKITFTKNSIDEWNESNTVKYNNISIGEFQVHKNRNCYKFRFNLENLIKII